jgi:Fic family protein
MKHDSVIITKDMLGLIADLDEFKGEWKAISNLAPERLNALKKVATIESIGSSTRIEGAKLSDQEIEQLLSGLDTKSFRSKDEEEVAGYAEAMDLIFESFENIPVTENHVKQLHGILLKYSKKDTRHRGEYKKMPNYVEAYDHNGKSLGIIFETASPFDTPGKMAALVKWTHDQLKEKDLHPLLVISIFVVHFLAIHPFQDGNGRLSRILTTLFLLKAGYAYVPYSSLEHVIEGNKDNYYLALRRTQKTLSSQKPDLEPWILFFLRSLKTQKDTLRKKLERENQLKKLPELSMKILQIVKDHGKATISEIQTITNANRNTLKVRLRQLVESKYLNKEGKGKGSWYTIGNTSDF